MFPKAGNKFPTGPERDYAVAISAALRSELGNTHRAAKTIMRWTDASERSAKNWLSGSRGPSGWHLILLIRQSDAVALTVLNLAGRDGAGAGLTLQTLRDAHLEAARSIDEQLRSRRN
jgi:hypothetical protein